MKVKQKLTVGQCNPNRDYLDNVTFKFIVDYYLQHPQTERHHRHAGDDADDGQVLFTGDCVAFNTPPVLEHTPDIHLWLKLLGELAQRRQVQRIVPGRGTDVILRGELETQREFLRVVQRTTVQLAAQSVPGEGLGQAATDLQQIFFPTISKNSPALQRLRRGLAHLVRERNLSDQ